MSKTPLPVPSAKVSTAKAELVDDQISVAGRGRRRMETPRESESRWVSIRACMMNGESRNTPPEHMPIHSPTCNESCTI